MKDIDSMTVAELRALQSDVAALIERRVAEERNSVLEKIKELAAGAGISLDELVRGAGARPTNQKPKVADKRRTVAPKYRDSATGTTWTGRGKKPKWVEAALASGKKLEDLVI